MRLRLQLRGSCRNLKHTRQHQKKDCNAKSNGILLRSGVESSMMPRRTTIRLKANYAIVDAIKHWRHYVVLLPQESMDNGSSLFDYGLDDPYNDFIDDFDPYLEYGEKYQNRTAFEDAFYR